MTIELEPWGDGHLELLRALNSPEMTEHLGGPETEEKVTERNERYVRLSGEPDGGTFVIRVDGEAAGNIGFWDVGDAWEMGWAVVPRFQGRGVATSAVLLALDVARSLHRHREVIAVPRVSNAASNAVCSRAGFTLANTAQLEYPAGIWALSHEWVFALED